MTDTEDLLTRTLRDPDRALPTPADPVTAIRARARAQRRTTTLAAAAVVLVAAAALLVPVALRRNAPEPVATTPPPASSDLLPWGARGPLAGEAALVQDARQVWRDAGGPAETWLVWAGLVDADRVVVLQGTDPNGEAVLGEVTDRGGRLGVLRAERIWEPGVQLVRLADPAARTDRTLLLPRPGAASLTLLAQSPDSPRVESVPLGALVTLDGNAEGDPVALFDREDKVLGDDLVPPTGQLLPRREDVRLVHPVWEVAYGGIRPPRIEDYDAGQVLGGQLARKPMQAPVSIGVLDDSTTVNLDRAATRKARPVSYELHQGDRVYFGSIVWVGDQPFCPRLQDVTGRQPDALVIRCRIPGAGGIVHVLLHEGIRMSGLRIAAAGPGQDAVNLRDATPVEGGLVMLLLTFPTGAGEVRLVDDAGTPRPPIVLPPYRP